MNPVWSRPHSEPFTLDTDANVKKKLSITLNMLNYLCGEVAITFINLNNI